MPDRKSILKIRRILVLCKGNICRSPYAHFKLQALLESANQHEIEILSAGLDTTPGKPADSQGIITAKSHDVDLGSHRTRRLDPAWLLSTDLVLIMDRSHWKELERIHPELLPKTLYLGALSPSLLEGEVIPDPFGLTSAHFERCYSRIDRCLNKLVKGWL